MSTGHRQGSLDAALGRAPAWRRVTGLIGALFALLAFLVLAEGLVANFTAARGAIDSIPGETHPVNGPIPAPATVYQDLVIGGQGDGVELVILEDFTGYFLGSAMWKGELRIGEGASPGVRILTVAPAATGQPVNSFQVTVHPNRAARLKASPSLITRTLMINPFVLAPLLALPMLAAIGINFLLSRRIERIRAEQGLAEIYLVRRKDALPDQVELGFALGSRHGLRSGSTILVVDSAGREIGRAVVSQPGEFDSLAVADKSLRVRPGHVAVIPSA